MRQPDVLTAFAALWSVRLDLEDWKRWLRWRLISGRASLLTDDLVDENFAFYGRTLSGTEELRDRWKRGVGVVESLMGDAVASSTSRGTSRPTPRPGWTTWWRTCARLTASASPTWSG